MYYKHGRFGQRGWWMSQLPFFNPSPSKLVSMTFVVVMQLLYLCPSEMLAPQDNSGTKALKMK